MPPKHIPPTYDQNKILWITEGEIGFLYDLINGLNRSNIYVNNVILPIYQTPFLQFLGYRKIIRRIL